MNGRDTKQHMYAALSALCLGITVVSYYLAAANKRPIYLVGVFVPAVVGIFAGFKSQYYRARQDSGAQDGLDGIQLIARAYKDVASSNRPQVKKPLHKDT